ncbi:hypothetical protein BC829DRAFT_42091 [Chytridium lagenaria]|nr:hypothetical protein BC829DRAFT_42091 [Chytridium lagenaria]
MDLETALKGLNLDLTLEDVELSAIAMSPRGEFRGDKGGFMGGESDEGLRKDGNGLLGDERDKEFGGNSSAFFDGESGELNSDRHAAIEENGQAKAKSVNEGNNGVGEHSRQSSAQSGGRTKIPVMYGRRMSESGGRRGLMEPTTGDGRSRGEIGEEEMRQSMARRFDALISDQLENADRALSQVTYTPEPSRPGTISPNAQFESFDLVHSVPSLSPSQTSPPTARATPNMRTRTIPTMRSTPSLSTTRDIFGLGRLPSPRPHDLAASQGSQRSNQPYYSNAKDINETIAEMDPPSSFFAMSVGSELRSPPVPYSNSFIIPPPRSAPTNLGASKGSAGGATRRFMAASSPNLATTMRFANGAMGGKRVRGKYQKFRSYRMYQQIHGQEVLSPLI